VLVPFHPQLEQFLLSRPALARMKPPSTRNELREQDIHWRTSMLGGVEGACPA
jgi:hypothetical protein